MDDGSLFLLAGLIVLYLLVGPGLGIAAFFRGKGASASDVAALRAQIDRLVMEVSILQRRAAEGDPATEAAPPVQERVQERTPEPPADEVPAEPAAAEQAAPVRPASPPSGVGIEQWLTSRGLVWLGGVTLALAGLFLAKYTYDHGWLALGPEIGRAHV